MKLLKNGNVFDVVNNIQTICDVLIDKNKIVEIGKDIKVDNECEIFDCTNLNVYPGFIDCHSHLGLIGSAMGFEGNDVNEMCDILTPHLRGVDAIEPNDVEFANAYKAGVTCVCTGPGSANVVGGQFVAIKTCGNRVDDMIVKANVAMKCAFGENPKRCYKDKNNYSRMSTAAKLREILFKTIEYSNKKDLAKDDLNIMPAFDMKLEAMIPVIKKQIPLKAHAHRSDDIFTAIRIAKEFDLLLTLEHVTDGSLIADQLAKENYMLAVGPTLGAASKIELVNKSFKTPGDLANAGCHVSIITDAPIIPQEFLPMCAALAIKDGMSEADGLRAITINPAQHIGLGDQIGSIEVGKDADIAIYDGSCFEMFTRAKYVFIDGIRVA